MKTTVKTIKNANNKNYNINYCKFELEAPVDFKAFAYACLKVLKKPMVSFSDYIYGIPYSFYRNTEFEKRAIPENYEEFCAETENEWAVISDGVSLITPSNNPKRANEITVEYTGDINAIPISLYNNIDSVMGIYNAICSNVITPANFETVTLGGLNYIKFKKNCKSKEKVFYLSHASGEAKKELIHRILSKRCINEYRMSADNYWEDYFNFFGNAEDFNNKTFGGDAFDTVRFSSVDNDNRTMIFINEDYKDENIYISTTSDREKYIEELLS